MRAPATTARQCPLHVVTNDRTLARDGFVARSERIARAGGARFALHLRASDTTGRRLFELAEALSGPVRSAGAALVINDRTDIAVALGESRVDGVHLGARSLPVGEVRRLLPWATVGRSVHSAEEVEPSGSAQGGPDYLFVGNVYETESHPGRPAAGTALVRSVVDIADCPVVAIGGVTPDRVGEVLGAGAQGVAVLSGVWSAADPEAAVRSYLSALEAEGS